MCALAFLAGCTAELGVPGGTQAASKGIALELSDDRVEALLDGRPLMAFQFDSKWDKPFLYPIRTVSGLVISRGWPVEPRQGEKQDHAWHRGIWYGHGDINGEDFWREKTDKTTSRLVLAAQPKTSDGALDVSLSMMTPKGRIGTIGERYTFRLDGNQVLIDSLITVSADQRVPLRFGDSDDGGFAFRLSDEFREDRGAQLINSDGLKGTDNIWGKPAKWVMYSAKVQGRQASVAMLDHPSNLRHPTRWHARGYSLCAANPFALGSFTKNKSNDGSYTLPAGQSLKLRYLIVVNEGGLPGTAVDRIFARFAKE